jgi:hypothetical protein
VLAALTIRNPTRAVDAEVTPRDFSCCLEATPLRSQALRSLEPAKVINVGDEQ